MPVPKSQLIAAILTFFLVSALIVVPIVLWAVTEPKSTIKTSCSSDQDCNNHGTCVNGACKCNSPWGGPFCSVLGNLNVASLAGGGNIVCSQTPTSCKIDSDCSVCDPDVQYSCQPITATQNSKGISGSFCLPVQPASDCLTGVPGMDSVPGFYNWNGWQDVEYQAWTCECEFPNFYPKLTVTVEGKSTDACLKSPQVCQHGDWTYPCLRDPSNPLTCLNKVCTGDAQCKAIDPNLSCIPITSGQSMCQVPPNTCKTISDCPGCGTAQYPPSTYTPDQVSALCGTTCSSGLCLKTCKTNTDCGGYPCVNGACMTGPATLVGANPFEYGQCDCQNHTCTSAADCAGDCVGGICVNQRVALDSTGVPTCIRDTCAPGGMFVPFPTPPYTYGYCECSTGYEAQGNTCVYTGNNKPSQYCPQGCGRGKCVSSGKCSCPSGWKGNENCTVFSCDQQVNCGNGSCTGPNTCSCDPGYLKDDNGACTRINCPQGCVNGTCVLKNQVPTCVCNPGFQGPSCNEPIAATCPALTHGTTSDTQGACIANNGSCAYELPAACTGAYFGTASSFQNSSSCGGNCVQGYTEPAVASLPPLLCSDGKSAAVPCSATNCVNTPIPLNTCLQNDLYSYSCTNLCDAYNELQSYDYNTVCEKKAAPSKPSFC